MRNSNTCTATCLQDLDLVKLTAQFVARNGKGFLTDLAMKETRNQDFNFLKSTHSMFTFFTALCDSYSKVLMPPAGTSDKLRRDATDRCAAVVSRSYHQSIPSACTSCCRPCAAAADIAMRLHQSGQSRTPSVDSCQRLHHAPPQAGHPGAVPEAA